MMRETRCNTWQEFKSLITGFASMPRDIRDAYVFRGQRDSAWSLETSLDRKFPQLNNAQREAKLHRLLKEFERELMGVGEPWGDSDIVTERLEFLARHHGLPTTVLDWMRSPYIAAFFAFESAEVSSSGEVAVWTINRRRLVTLPEAEDVLINKMSYIKRNSRAIEQRGEFVRLPIGSKGEKLLSKALIKFTIPQSERRIALNDLDEMVINARMLFRDTDAAARTAWTRECLAEDTV